MPGTGLALGMRLGSALPRRPRSPGAVCLALRSSRGFEKGDRVDASVVLGVLSVSYCLRVRGLLVVDRLIPLRRFPLLRGFWGRLGWCLGTLLGL